MAKSTQKFGTSLIFWNHWDSLVFWRGEGGVQNGTFLFTRDGGKLGHFSTFRGWRGGLARGWGRRLCYRHKGRGGGTIAPNAPFSLLATASFKTLDVQFHLLARKILSGFNSILFKQWFTVHTLHICQNLNGLNWIYILALCKAKLNLITNNKT